MKNSAIISIIIFFIICFLFSPGTKAGTPGEDEKAIIAKAIRDSIGWALTKDRPLLESLIAHDDRLFMFNPDSQATVGWDQFVKGFDFWMDSRFKATYLDMRDLRIDFSRTGDVAWWSCILDDLGEWDGRPIGWKDTRWTGVIEKRDGKWLIVQMHFSFASDKVAADTKAKLQTRWAETLYPSIDYIYPYACLPHFILIKRLLFFLSACFPGQNPPGTAFR